ncbi:MAG: carboxypeptidase regulatory-like domain-containing protein [Candidatus Niyogibacteria bacterium]|nr:carboxypeptidase regulatory-like domain-containing protein [Candidatus Niyogibacteria bacterium]
MTRTKTAAVVVLFISFFVFVAFIGKTASSAEKTGLSIITGQVVDMDGVPVDQIAVSVRTSDNQQVGITFTNERGIFVLYNMPPGFYEFSLLVVGYNNSVPKILHYTGKVQTVDLGVMKLVFRPAQ